MTAKNLLFISFCLMIAMHCLADQDQELMEERLKAEKRQEMMQAQLEALKVKVKGVEIDLLEVKGEMGRRTIDIQKFKHKVLYAHGPPAALHKEMIEIERKLAVKRKELDELIMKSPEIHEFIKKRNELREKKTYLADRKTLLNNEIIAIRNRLIIAKKKEESK